MRLLLEKGANINEADKVGRSPRGPSWNGSGCRPVGTLSVGVKLVPLSQACSRVRGIGGFPSSKGRPHWGAVGRVVGIFLEPIGGRLGNMTLEP